MTSKLTRERLQEIINLACKTCSDGSVIYHKTHTTVDSKEIVGLARMALAAMDSEPVIADCDPEVYEKGASACLVAIPKETAEVICKGISAVTGCKIDWHYIGGRVNIKALRLSPQPAPERDQVRSAHAEWSLATFGNVGPVGPLKHLSKEALEAAEQPGDLSEWADMQFLLWDAQRRAGITDEQITQAMIEKLAVNKQREWPEPKDGEPRMHIKEQPAPVVQCPYPCGWDTLNKLAIQDAAFVALSLVAGEPATESIRQAAITNSDRLLKVISACRAATQEVKGE